MKSDQDVSLFRHAMGAAVVLSVVLLSDAPADLFPLAPVSMNWVTVRDAGNPADTQAGDGSYGMGSVNYAYNIAKYEVTAGQYTVFLNAVAATDTYGLYHASMSSDEKGCGIQRTGTSGSYTYAVASDYAKRPVNFVSWGDATRFVNWLHNDQPGLNSPVAQDAFSTEDGAYYLNGAVSKADLMAVTREPDARYWLPSGDEWYKAAYYDPNKDDGTGGTGAYWYYPTGADQAPSYLLTPDVGNNATFKSGDNYTIGGPYWLTEAGAHEGTTSPYGAYDMAGNLREWTEQILSGNRGNRGGHFDAGSNQMEASYRGNQSPTDQAYHIGFRIATIPEPGSGLMLLAGAAGLLLWRRRVA